jgi:hypothetical protein
MSNTALPRVTLACLALLGASLSGPAAYGQQAPVVASHDAAAAHAAEAHQAETGHAETGHAEGEHPAAEHDAIATARPGLAEYTGTVGKGVVQVEGGYSLTRAGGENSHAFGEALVRFGVARNAELRIGFNSYTRASDHGHVVSGFEDAEVGVKAGLVESARGVLPSVSLLVGTTVPTGSEEIGRTEWQPAAAMSLGWELPGHMALTSAVNYAYLADHDERVRELTSATSLGFPLLPGLHGHAEYALIAPVAHFDSKLHHFSGGFGYHVTHDVQLDVWGGGASHHGESETLFGLGLSRRW